MTSQAPQHSSFDQAKAWGIAAAFAAGLVSALQTRVNGQLGGQIGNPFLTATFNFASAVVILAVIMAFSPRARAALRRVMASLKAGRRGGSTGSGSASAGPADAHRHPGVPGIGHLRWFQIIGGAAGGLFVISQAWSSPHLGVAMFVVAVTAGQSVSSLFCDMLGFAPGGRRPITFLRALGPLLTLVAVLVARWVDITARQDTGIDIGFIVLPIIAGIFVAAQHAVNGRVETTAGYVPEGYDQANPAQRHEVGAGALTATFINFVAGTVFLLIALAISLVLQGWPSMGNGFEWWMFTGGALGVIFIGTLAAVVPRIGALLLALSLIAGQTTGGVILDSTGILAPAARTPSVAEIIAIGLVVVAIAIPAFVTRSQELTGSH